MQRYRLDKNGKRIPNGNCGKCGADVFVETDCFSPYLIAYTCKKCGYEKHFLDKDNLSNNKN